MNEINLRTYRTRGFGLKTGSEEITPISISARNDLPWTRVHGVAYASVAIDHPYRSAGSGYLPGAGGLPQRRGAAWRETDESASDFHAVVSDLLTGQYDQPLRVVAFNPAEGWSRDASEEVAQELARLAAEEGREISEALQEFIESHTGRAIGVQLALPLRGF